MEIKKLIFYRHFRGWLIGKVWLVLERDITKASSKKVKKFSARFLGFVYGILGSVTEFWVLVTDTLAWNSSPDKNQRPKEG